MEGEPTSASTASRPLRAAGVYGMAAFCLAVGLAIGYVAEGSRKAAAPAPQVSSSLKQPHPENVPAGRNAPGLAGMKQMADNQAAPLLEKLKSNPGDSTLLVQLGGVYHSNHQFTLAAEYYGKAVEVDPKNVATRTRLASSLYRSGDVDGAILQLNRALSYSPHDANALFDLGMIRLQGKQDSKGALAVWQKLLKTNPQLSADRKATVQKLMADVLTTLSYQKGSQGARSNDEGKSKSN